MPPDISKRAGSPHPAISGPAAIRLPIHRVGALRAMLGLILANLRMMLKGLRWWWYLVAGGLPVGELVSPIELGRSIWLPLAWLWPLLIWSALGNRERALHTE